MFHHEGGKGIMIRTGVAKGDGRWSKRYILDVMLAGICIFQASRLNHLGSSVPQLCLAPAVPFIAEILKEVEMGEWVEKHRATSHKGCDWKKVNVGCRLWWIDRHARVCRQGANPVDDGATILPHCSHFRKL